MKMLFARVCSLWSATWSARNMGSLHCRRGTWHLLRLGAMGAAGDVLATLADIQRLAPHEPDAEEWLNEVVRLDPRVRVRAPDLGATRYRNHGVGEVRCGDTVIVVGRPGPDGRRTYLVGPIDKSYALLGHAERLLLRQRRRTVVLALDAWRSVRLQRYDVVWDLVMWVRFLRSAPDPGLRPCGEVEGWSVADTRLAYAGAPAEAVAVAVDGDHVCVFVGRSTEEVSVEQMACQQLKRDLDMRRRMPRAIGVPGLRVRLLLRTLLRPLEGFLET